MPGPPCPEGVSASFRGRRRNPASCTTHLIPKPMQNRRIPRRTSVRRRLLLFLIPSLLLLVVGAATLTYFVALHVATYAYDRSLLDPALDIAANITTDGNGTRLAMQEQAQQALLYDHEDTVVFQVRTPAGD